VKTNYYANRAALAHAAAESASDPRDKAAFRAAAQTWERLAKPATQTYSMAPHRLQVAELKRDVAEAIDAPASTPAVKEVILAAAHGMNRVIAKPVTIEF